MGPGRSTSLTLRLLLLIGTITVPLTLLSAAIIDMDYRADRMRAEAQLVQHAQTIARLVDREIERAQATARAVAASSALWHGDLEALRIELIEVSRTYGEGLPPGAQPVMMGLSGIDGNWILNTAPLEGNSRPHPAPREGRRAIETGQPQVSDLYIGSVTGQPRISVAVPVFADPREGDASRRVIGAIGVAISRERFLQIVNGTKLPPGALASIQDRRGITIARSERDAETVGTFPAPAVLQAILSADVGLAPPGTRTLDGTRSTVAFARAPASRFIVKLDIPEAVFIAPLRAALLRTAGLVLVVLICGLRLALVLARKMVVALRRVVPSAQAAAQTAAETASLPPSLDLLEADELAAELTRVLCEQRAAAQALAASEAKFRTLADALPQLVWAAGPDGHCDYFNARCYSFIGTDTLDDDLWNETIHPDDRSILEAAWHQALTTGDPFEVESRRLRHDGVYRWMLVRAIPVASVQMGEQASTTQSSGPIVRWFGSSTDITDLVAARDVAARNRAELETRIEERTHDLREMQTRLARAAHMEALGQLAGGIAHDFNNVLQAVMGGSALIERKPDDPALVAKHARRVFESAERGATITRRLLAFSHRSALRAELIDTTRLLHDMREILTHTLGAAMHTEIAAAPDLPPILADKSQLETVLVNLATNARDAMAGQGTIVLGAATETVVAADPTHPVALEPGAYVRLSVTDTGIGMDAALLERVVEPFFTTKRTGQGTGLGLAMAHGFAGQSGGGLHIESAPGKGTTVKLWLPVGTEPAAMPQSADPDPSRRRSARLLLVDDEDSVRDVVKDALESEGYTVVVAVAAEPALALLAESRFDALISDLSMPGMDGVSLIRLAQQRQPGLPAILVTGFARDETEIAMSGAFSGSFSVLRKPVTLAQLSERVTDLLQSARSR